MPWFVWKEKGRDRRRWRRPRVSLPLLETKWNWAVDALKGIRKESVGMRGRRWARRAYLELVNTSSPLFFQAKGCEPAWG